MPIYDDLHSEYIAQTFAAEDAVLGGIEERLTSQGLPTIKLNAEEGRFLQCLVAISGAKLGIEFGTLGGYSATCIARGLPKNGRLISIELNPKCAAVARGTFEQANLTDKVELIEGDALTLLPEMSRRGPFDFVFIDTVTKSYATFLDWALENTRPGSIIAAHNAFGYGGLFSEKDPEGRKAAIRAFNEHFASRQQLLSTIFPAGDGTVFGIVTE